MKRSDLHIYHRRTLFRLATAFLWLLPLFLCVPNIALDITELSYLPLDRIINVIVPLGAYMVICSLFSRPGIAGLLFIPLMVLCAFQIVLLFLYGESIIAIDMFLNVATTNSTEVEELLNNLRVAIIVVCLIYLPIIGVAIYLTAKGAVLPWSSRQKPLLAGIVFLVAGCFCMVYILNDENPYRIDRKLFPVNVISNMFKAVERSGLNSSFRESSAGFRFMSEDTRKSSRPEIYVMIIGETSRAKNWQLNGYDRSTNPRLSRRNGLVSFRKALSESNTTHKSVPLMMSPLNASAFNDSIYRTRSIIDAFAEAGYATGWYSNQKRNHSLIDFYGEEAHESVFVTDDGQHHYDSDLCGYLDRFLDKNSGKKCFVVLHTYGSHFNYKERYPQEYAYFREDSPCTASKDNRERLVNAYDNSIRFIDMFIDSIIGIVDSRHEPAAVVYAADHGEDIYDDSRGRFLHASPTPTYRQLHVPMLVWTSADYRASYPEKQEAIMENADKNVSTSHSVFHTLLSLAGIDAPVLDKSADVSSRAYSEPRRIFLNDYNEAVPLDKAGIRKPDFEALAHAGIKL